MLPIPNRMRSAFTSPRAATTGLWTLDCVGACEVFQSFPPPPDVVRVGRRRHDKLRGFVSGLALRADFFAIVNFFAGRV
jgi:hypothetical protein